MAFSQARKHVELYKLRQTLEQLQQRNADRQNLLSLLIPPKADLTEVLGLIEENKAPIIVAGKTTTNSFFRPRARQAFSSIASVLKGHYDSKIPVNGLVFYATLGDEFYLNIHFEPFAPLPLQTVLYRCDTHFHVEALEQLFEQNGGSQVGVILIDDTETNIATLCGSQWIPHFHIVAYLPEHDPKAMDRAIRTYCRRAVDLSLKYFIDEAKKKAKIDTLIIGSNRKMDFAEASVETVRAHPILKGIPLATVTVESSTMKSLFESVDQLANKFPDLYIVQEEKVLQQVLKQGSEVVVGVEKSIAELEKGSAKLVVCIEHIKINRYVLKGGKISYGEYPEDEVEESSSLIEFIGELVSKSDKTKDVLIIPSHLPLAEKFVEISSGLAVIKH